MQFVIGFWVGIAAGFILRNLVDRLVLDLKRGRLHDGKKD